MRLEVKTGWGREGLGGWVRELRLCSMGDGEQRKGFQWGLCMAAGGDKEEDDVPESED